MNSKRGHRQILTDLERDQFRVGDGLAACKDLFIWLKAWWRGGRITWDEYQRMDLLVREAVAGLAVLKKWLAWIRWGKNLRNYRESEEHGGDELEY